MRWPQQPHFHVEFDNTSIEPTEIEAAVHLHARKFVILCGLWLALGGKSAKAFFNTALDNEYSPKLRFAANDDANKEQPCQAQLRELHNIMEPELRAYITQCWFSKAVPCSSLLADSPTHNTLVQRWHAQPACQHSLSSPWTCPSCHPLWFPTAMHQP
jgi:hypothetical protein